VEVALVAGAVVVAGKRRFARKRTVTTDPTPDVIVIAVGLAPMDVEPALALCRVLAASLGAGEGVVVLFVATAGVDDRRVSVGDGLGPNVLGLENV